MLTPLRPHLGAAVAVAALALLAPPSPALASDAEPGSGWNLVLGAGTDLPLAVNAHAALEGPYRLRLSSSLGLLPGAYVDAINRAVVKAGGYDEDTGRAVKAAVERSLVWRTHLGLRLWRGLYVEGGYGLVTLGGSATGSQILEIVTGQPFPPVEGGDRPFRADATLHMADVEVGYVLQLPARLSLRLAVGAAFTVDSAVSITADYPPTAPAQVAEFERAAEEELRDDLRRYGNVPVVSVSLGYQLF